MDTQDHSIDPQRDDLGEALLRLPQVIAMTGASRSTIYAWEKKSLFPRRVAVGPRIVAWRKSEVLEFVRSRRLAQ